MRERNPLSERWLREGWEEESNCSSLLLSSPSLLLCWTLLRREEEEILATLLLPSSPLSSSGLENTECRELGRQSLDRDLEDGGWKMEDGDGG